MLEQILSPANLNAAYRRALAKNSYGFRPKRSAHQALQQCQRYIIEGYKYAIDMDRSTTGRTAESIVSNIMLNELDKELERRGHRFVCYVDDLLILCKSKRASKRTMENLEPFIEEKLLLKVNRQKSTVVRGQVGN